MPVAKTTAMYNLPRKQDAMKKMETLPPRQTLASNLKNVIPTTRKALATSVPLTSKAPAKVDGVSFARLAAATDRSDDIADFEEEAPPAKGNLGKRTRKNAEASSKEKEAVDDGDDDFDFEPPPRRLVS